MLPEMNGFFTDKIKIELAFSENLVEFFYPSSNDKATDADPLQVLKQIQSGRNHRSSFPVLSKRGRELK